MSAVQIKNLYFTVLVFLVSVYTLSFRFSLIGLAVLAVLTAVLALRCVVFNRNSKNVTDLLGWYAGAALLAQFGTAAGGIIEDVVLRSEAARIFDAEILVFKDSVIVKLGVTAGAMLLFVSWFSSVKYMVKAVLRVSAFYLLTCAYIFSLTGVFSRIYVWLLALDGVFIFIYWAGMRSSGGQLYSSGSHFCLIINILSAFLVQIFYRQSLYAAVAGADGYGYWFVFDFLLSWRNVIIAAALITVGSVLCREDKDKFGGIDFTLMTGASCFIALAKLQSAFWFWGSWASLILYAFAFIRIFRGVCENRSDGSKPGVFRNYPAVKVIAAALILSAACVMINAGYIAAFFAAVPIYFILKLVRKKHAPGSCARRISALTAVFIFSLLILYRAAFSPALMTAVFSAYAVSAAAVIFIYFSHPKEKAGRYFSVTSAVICAAAGTVMLLPAVRHGAAYTARITESAPEAGYSGYGGDTVIVKAGKGFAVSGADWKYLNFGYTGGGIKARESSGAVYDRIYKGCLEIVFTGSGGTVSKVWKWYNPIYFTETQTENLPFLSGLNGGRDG